MGIMINSDLLNGGSVHFADKLYTAASLKMIMSISGKPVLALFNSEAEVSVMFRSLA
jgi:hypothetical protein